ncbi:TMEM175 family protein [Enterococcus sp. CSURQ0835]|uniref:TMEM175 family protein n=1 Tax=Enterococcus sp. CSURQ0835 TaxID=2681394 RepID=UPI001359235D|nr:TMEM175 family protein [Enterococcus sp. CSURQ0835]
MTKSRLEAFTDGVVAIVLTVLILDIQIPNSPTLASIYNILNTLLAYTISFIFVAVIWVNHHRVMQMAEKINYGVIWANIFWLFWLTLCPAVTSWVGRNPTSFWPEIFYVLVYTMWSFSFGILSKKVVAANEPTSHVAKVLSRDRRSGISMVINLVTLAGVFIYPPLGMLGRFLVSGIWIMSYRKADYWYHRIFTSK